MTYTLFLQIEDDTRLDPADRLLRVAILSEDHTLPDLNYDFDQILDTCERQYGFRPTELDT